MNKQEVKTFIENNQAILGIELGSTRIKAVLIDDAYQPIASGGYQWENRFENNIWTYSLEDVWAGLKGCYADLKKNVQDEYGVTLSSFKSIGISAMMHGYMVFDENDRLLSPFRTWRNTITEQAAAMLSEAFSFNIPQRWSIAHLYQSILEEQAHVKDIRYITTLSGFLHYKLTGKKVLGIGDAAGMFPIDSKTHDFVPSMLDTFDEMIKDKSYPWKIRDILPTVMVAGEDAGTLTKEGALIIDEDGDLTPGIPLCPPEGDAGTGMVATNSVKIKTGNVSAGTSIFSMVVLEHALSDYYEQIDMVTTPAGDAVAMAHCNNCTPDIDVWVNLFAESMRSMGIEPDMNKLFTTMFEKALEADADCNDMLSYNYQAGEHVTGFDRGVPLVMYMPGKAPTLASFMRTLLSSAVATLRIGMDILIEKENIQIERMVGHGGFFKTPVVGQKILASAIHAPITVSENAGEGGAWGMALLAAYMVQNKGESLADYLAKRVFANQDSTTITPDEKDIEGFTRFIERYKKGLAVERAAVDM